LVGHWRTLATSNTIRTVEECVDRAEFVAKIVGAKNKRRELQGPWHLPSRAG
jgi:hypothetical protein